MVGRAAEGRRGSEGTGVSTVKPDILVCEESLKNKGERSHYQIARLDIKLY